jgi:hypothetical protein
LAPNDLARPLCCEFCVRVPNTPCDDDALRDELLDPTPLDPTPLDPTPLERPVPLL